MAAFTDEQFKILQAAFEHVWAVVEWYREYMQKNSMQLEALLDNLQTRGVLTHEQVEEIARIYENMCGDLKLHRPGEFSELQTTQRILDGDVSAFTHELEQWKHECELEHEHEHVHGLAEKDGKLVRFLAFKSQRRLFRFVRNKVQIDLCEHEE